MSMTPLPYATPSSNQRDIDQIKLLVIFTYVWGGLLMLFSCFGLIYVALGMMFIKAPAGMFPTTGPAAGQPPPTFMGWIFVAIGGGIILFGWIIAGLNFYSARGMQTQRRRMFSIVVAGIDCMFFPVGTALGVCSFMVLLRESVPGLYHRDAQPAGT